MNMSSWSTSSSFPRSRNSRPQHEQDAAMTNVTMDREHLSRRASRVVGSIGRTQGEERHPYYYPSFPTQQPLVLDPSSSQSLHQSRSLSEAGASHYHTDGLVKKLLAAATISRRAPEHEETHDTTTAPVSDTAACFARSAPRAGFLLKLGTNVVEFKRRFFVLQSTTFLYYFLSPNDVEPRGCIDLKHASIKDATGLRFELNLGNDRVVMLEARTNQVKQEWMEALEKERLEYCKEELKRAKQQIEEQRIHVSQLEQEMEQYRHVENDRDMALEDAAAWKLKYEQLQEGVRLLTRHVRRPPSCDAAQVKSNLDVGEQNSAEKDTLNDNNVKEVELDDNTDTGSGEESTTEPASGNDNTTPDDKSTPGTPNTSHREISLLDSVSHNQNGHDDDDMDELLHDMANELDSGSFSSLLNACLQLMENVRLASVEATTAVEDLHGAQDVLVKTQKRMTKAERHLCKLWEENCALRKSMKNVKKEKKILKQEVKSLMAISKEEEQAERQEEERLIHELEEHVMTSIRLHEQLLSGGNENLLTNDPATTSPSSTTLSTAIVPANVAPQEQETMEDGGTGSPENIQLTDNVPNAWASYSAERVIASLVDTDTESDTDENDDEDSMAPSLVSLVAGGRLGDGNQHDENDSTRDDEVVIRDEVTGAIAVVSNDVKLSTEIPDSYVPVVNVPESLVSGPSSDDSVEERKNPLLQLNDTEDEESKASGPSSDIDHTKQTVTDNGKATSRLISPLADVVGSSKSTDKGVGDDGLIYHLTFYSKKIGLQFQKVPMPNTSRGLLTEAMTADLGEAAVPPHDKTAADLKRIAAISRLATKGATDDDDQCPVASPVDAVLVCGLNGFDDSSQRRPKLGARLVAFDGLSVEVGPWTFDSVRKAIQARGRPLTLSFRNDMLSTSQRTILTKAIADVHGHITPSSRPPLARHVGGRPSVGSVSSAVSNDRTPIEKIDSSFRQNANSDDDDDRSVSTMASVSIASDQQSNFESRTNPYSFSDAGTTSVVSSAFGPLMANLMSGLSHSEKTEASTPQYLRREATESLEHAERHRQFQESLL